MTDEPFVSPCAPPEGLERELLVVLGEEGAEVLDVVADITKRITAVQVRASKALRFGLDEIQPGQAYSNRQRLAREIGDFYAVVDRLLATGTLLTHDISAGYTHKQAQLNKFLQQKDTPS